MEPIARPSESEVNLDDERTQRGHDFNSATLQLGQNVNETKVEFRTPGPAQPQTAGGFSARPSSSVSRRSTGSLSNKTQENPNTICSEFAAKNYFSKRAGAFENAVEHMRDSLRQDIDGEVQGAWLLTEIDHWDHEHERIVLLCQSTICIGTYDFVAMKVLSVKRILLHIIDTVTIGDLIYPEKSLMKHARPRQHGGVRVAWGKNKPMSFGQKWNPWCSDVPMTTFAHHPLHYHERDGELLTYNVDDFHEYLIQAVRKSYHSKALDVSQLTIEEGQILIETYMSLSSMVFNQSHLGFSKERGGVSF